MTARSLAETSRGDDDDFVHSSFLSYKIPRATDYRLEQALEQHDGPPEDFFESIENRESLFFGVCH